MSALQALAFSAALAAALAATPRLCRARRPSAINHRGDRLATVLGWAVVLGLYTGLLVALVTGGLARRPDERAPSQDVTGMLVGIAIVFLAGFYDDCRSGEVRGVIRHARALLEGRFTSGILKLVAAVAASALVAATGSVGLARALVGIPVMAGSANLWNLLDVSPGRAIKYFTPAAIVLSIAVAGSASGLVLAAALGGALAVAAFDLRERAMLGDSGSNVLGFVLGIGLFATLPLPWLLTALAAILALHVVAETVTLSRAIRSIPPLAWFDRLGRVAESENPRGWSATIKSRGA